MKLRESVRKQLRTNPHQAEKSETEVPPEVADLIGGGGWTRTNDLRIMSRPTAAVSTRSCLVFPSRNQQCPVGDTWGLNPNLTFNGVPDFPLARFTLVTSFTSKRSEWLGSECVNIFDGKVYQLALKQSDKLDKVIPRTYAHVLYRYTKHPEAKSLAPDGTPCMCDTRGLLQRSSVVAASRRYVGKETDRRWEQGEDMSLIEFKSLEYQQSKQVLAGEDIKHDILCLLYTSPSPRDLSTSRMPSSA